MGSSTTITVTVNPAPAMTNSSTVSICSGTSPDISLTSGIASSYVWSLGTNTGGITGSSSGSGSSISQTLGNPSNTTPGSVQYLVTPTSTASSCIGTPSTITVTVNPIPLISITQNYCGSGGEVAISSNAFSSYLWSTGQTTQSILTNVAGIFTVTATNSYGCSSFNNTTVAVELVTNGHFTDGNTGFTTAYTYHPGYYCSSCTQPDTTGLWPEGRYAIGSNANNYHSEFFGTYYTSPGSGNFMIVNGSPSTGLITVWSENITVQPYTTYYFSAWAMSLNQVTPYAELRFAVNGEQVGTTDDLGAGANSTSGPFTWSQFYGNWTSGSSTTATLSIVDINTAAGGNDFGLDDISCSTLSPIAFNVAPSGGGTTVCQGNSFTLSSNVTGIASPFTYSWSGPNSFTSTDSNLVINNATVAMSGDYDLTVTDAHGCQSNGIASVIVNPIPTVTSSVSASTICDGSSINLTSSANTYTNILLSEEF